MNVPSCSYDWTVAVGRWRKKPVTSTANFQTLSLSAVAEHPGKCRKSPIKGKWLHQKCFMTEYQRLDSSWVLHITTKHYICLDCTATMYCLFFFFFLISTCMKFIILLTIKWMKHIPRTPEKRPAKAIWWRAAGGTSSGCCGCCPCPRGVKSFAVEHCDLWPPFTLPSLPVDRRVTLSTVNWKKKLRLVPP